MTYAAQKLEDDLKEIALRMDFDDGELLCREAICLGDWVMLAAMKRREAGELHTVAGRPAETVLGEHPWKIRLVEASGDVTYNTNVNEIFSKMPDNTVAELKKSLQFRYAHSAATAAPSKQTATGRKGRQKDAEAAEGTPEEKLPNRTWRRPSFLERQVEGKTVGNAIHNAMQYLRYASCGSISEVRKEVERLVEQGFLTQEQAMLVDCEKIACFFATDVGSKLRSGIPHLREFKFSILDAGNNYGAGLEEEQVLLQGVVDCALLEPDGITVLDFKTDYVTPETIERRAEHYRPQLETYADALSRIYEQRIKRKLLYFFRLNQFVEL